MGPEVSREGPLKGRARRFEPCLPVIQPYKEEREEVLGIYE